MPSTCKILSCILCRHDQNSLNQLPHIDQDSQLYLHQEEITVWTGWSFFMKPLILFLFSQAFSFKSMKFYLLFLVLFFRISSLCLSITFCNFSCLISSLILMFGVFRGGTIPIKTSEILHIHNSMSHPKFINLPANFDDYMLDKVIRHQCILTQKQIGKKFEIITYHLFPNLEDDLFFINAVKFLNVNLPGVAKTIAFFFTIKRRFRRWFK